MSTATILTPTPSPSPERERARPTEAAPGHPLGARLAAGDDDVIVEMYREFGGRMMALALNVLRDRPLAEEAVQETFLRVWRRSATFDPTRGLEPWLFRIARNTAYDMARARSRRPRSQWGDPEPALGTVADVDRMSDPAVASDTLAVQWEVRAAIDALPERERDVVRLQHLGGLSHREIAVRLDINIGTVKSRSHRAHARLAAALGDARERVSDAA